jgi:cytoskeleton protein RodZ
MNNSVGEQLRAAREAKHLSLEQAAQTTFIKIRFLEALENDRKEDLHTPVQARGFLRMYADLLGLKVEPLLDLWDGINPPDEPILTAAEELPPQPESAELQEAVPPQPERFILDDEFETPPLVEVEEFEPITDQTSAEVFKEIGRVLKQRREALKITFEDVEKFVHIRPRYLLALEEGRLDDLPSTVQGRGMLTNYAHFLEVDSNRLQLRFAEALQIRRLELIPAEPVKQTGRAASRPAPSKPTQKAPGPRSPLKRILTPDLMIAVPLILMLFGFSIWAVYEVVTRGNSSPDDMAAAPGISSVLLEETTAPDSLATGAPVVEATSALAQEATQQASTQQAVVVDLPTLAATGDMPLNVYVVAKENAWLKVTVGKSEVFNDRVIPGNAYPFSGTERIEILTGNAAGLQVFYNQRDLGSLGLTGQVADLVFTLDGIITPTPRFSPTPTITQLATQTLQPTSTPAPATVTPLIPK